MLLKTAFEVRVSPRRLLSIFLEFFNVFKWICAVLVLVARLVGLFMFTTWAVDCFSREYHTTALCVRFTLFPRPKIFESVWLCLCFATSAFLILHACRLNHFPGFLPVLQHLIKQKYFLKLLLTLFAVCVYDVLTMAINTETLKTVAYIIFVFEKFFAVAVVLVLNFLPSDANDLHQKNSLLKLVLYKAALAVYAIEGYTMAMLGSTIAAYKVLSVPSTPDGSKDPPEVKAVASLMLLLANNALRVYLAEFFLSKVYDQDADILRGGTKSIAESLALPVGQAQEDEEASTNV